MSYAKIAHTEVTRRREDGSIRRFEIIIRRFDALIDDMPIPIQGEPVIDRGSQNDTILKPVKTLSLTMHLKSSAELVPMIRKANYREYQLIINELESETEVFSGFILPGLAEYDLYKDVQTLRFTASAGMKEMQNDRVEGDTRKTLREFFSDAAGSTGISRQVDFITRIRSAGQGSEDPIPNRLRDFETGMILSEDGNREEAILQLNQQFNFQLIQDNGRWVVADIFERWKNPQSARRYEDDGEGGYTVTSDDLLISLGKDNSVRWPGGRGEISIGRVVMQRELMDRDVFWIIQPITNQVFPIAPVVGIYDSIERQTGFVVSGDVISLNQFSIQLQAKEAISGSVVNGLLKAVKITFESFFTGETVWYDFVASEWVEDETFGQVNFSLFAGDSLTTSFATELRIPEGDLGKITIEIRNDASVTSGEKADLESMTLKSFQVDKLLLPREEVPILFHQWSALSQSGAGRTVVYPFFSAESEEYAQGQTMEASDDGISWDSIDEFYDEYEDSNARLGEISARRKAKLLLGQTDSFFVDVSDTVPVSLLSVIDFTEGDITHRCFPLHIKQHLFSGKYRIKMKPVIDPVFDLASQYSYLRIESDEGMVGSSRSNSRPVPNVFLTGSFFNSTLNKLLSLEFDITTTAELSGLVDQIPVSEEVDIIKGQKILVIDPNTLDKRVFIASEDVEQGTIIIVEPLTLSGTLRTGSFVNVGSNPVITGLLTNQHSFQIFSESDAIGQVIEAVDGIVDEISVNLFSFLSAGEVVDYLIPDQDAPSRSVIRRPSEDVTSYESGIQQMKIKEQYLTLAEGTYFKLNGVSFSSRRHVDPGKVQDHVERIQAGNAIGTLGVSISSDAPVSSIQVKPNSDIDIKVGQVLRVQARDGLFESITIDENKSLNEGISISLAIVEKTFDRNYEGSLVNSPTYIYEAGVTLSGRLTIEAAKVALNAANISGQADQIAGLLLDVTENGVSIASLFAETDSIRDDLAIETAARLLLRSDFESAEATLSANVNQLGTDLQIETDARLVLRSDFDTANATLTANFNQLDGELDTEVTARLALEASVDQAIIDLETDVNGNTVGINIINNGLADGSGITITGLTTFQGDVEVNPGFILRSSDFNATTKEGWRLTDGAQSKIEVANGIFWNSNLQSGELTEFKFNPSTISLSAQTLHDYEIKNFFTSIAPSTGTVGFAGIATESSSYMMIHNIHPTNLIKFYHQSGLAPDAENRIITPTGATIDLLFGEMIALVRDSSANRWRVLKQI